MSYQARSPIPYILLTNLQTGTSVLPIFPATILLLLLLLTYRHLSNSSHLTSDLSFRARLRRDLHGITEQLDVADLEINHQTARLDSLQNELREKDVQLVNQAARLASQAHNLALKDMTHKVSYMKLNRRNAMLAAQLKATRKEMNDRSFATFCERLLLNNKIWQGEKELKLLAERIRSLEGSMVGWGGVGMDDADAKQEAVVEELIQEIVDDLEESQKHVSTLLSRHKAEVKAINDGWARDYGILAQGEQAKAGRPASIVEGAPYEGMDESSLDVSDEDMGSPTSTVLDELEPDPDPDATLIHINAHLKVKLSSMESEDLDLRSLPPPSISCEEIPPPLNTFCLSCPTSSPICFSPTFHLSPLALVHPARPRHHSNPTITPAARFKRPHRDSCPTRDPSSNAALEALKGKLPMWPVHAGQLPADAGASRKVAGRLGKFQIHAGEILASESLWNAYTAERDAVQKAFGNVPSDKEKYENAEFFEADTTYIVTAISDVIHKMEGELGVPKNSLLDGISILSEDSSFEEENDPRTVQLLARMYSVASPSSVEVHLTYHCRCRSDNVEWYIGIGYKINSRATTKATPKASKILSQIGLSNNSNSSFGMYTRNGWNSFYKAFYDDEQGFSGSRWKRYEVKEVGLYEDGLRDVHDALLGPHPCLDGETPQSPVNDALKRRRLVQTARLLLACVGVDCTIATKEDEWDEVPNRRTGLAWALEGIPRWFAREVRKAAGFRLERDAIEAVKYAEAVKDEIETPWDDDEESDEEY